MRRHALAVEVHLRPVLVEIGATVPTRGLYVTEDQLDDLSAVIDAWLVEAAPALIELSGVSQSPEQASPDSCGG